MTAERLTFRDIAAALKAAKQAGVSFRRIEVRKDAVVLIPGDPETVPEPKTEETEEEILRRYRQEAEDYGKV